MKSRFTSLSRVTSGHGGNSLDAVCGESIFELRDRKPER